MANRDEIIRLILEADGEQDADKLAAALKALRSEAAAAGGEAQSLVNELEGLAAASKAARSISSLKAAIADTDRQLEAAEQGLIALSREFSAADRSSASVARAFKRAGDAVEDLKKRQASQTLELQRAQGALAKAGVDTTKLGEAQRTIAQQTQAATARVATFTQQLRQTKAASEGTASGLRSIGTEAGGAASRLNVVELGLGKISVAAAAAATAFGAMKLGSDALSGAVELQQSLAQISAVAGASAEELRLLREAAQQAAAETGLATKDITEGLGDLARTGLSARDAIATLRPALDLAQGGGLGLSEAIGILTPTLTQFGLASSDAARVVDVLAQAANVTEGSVQRFGLSLSYVAPLAKQLGLDLEGTVGILAALAKEGFQGERAGTALRNVFSQLLDPSSRFREELELLNIRGNDLGSILQQLVSKGDAGKRALLALDAEARPAILALFGKGGESIKQFVTSLEQAEGQAAKTAAKVRDTLGTAWTALGEVIDNTFANLIDPLLIPLQAEIQRTAQRIVEFAKSPAFAELQQKLVGVFEQSILAVQRFAENFDPDQIANDVGRLLSSLRQLLEVVTDLADKASIAAVALKALSNPVTATADVLELFDERLGGALSRMAGLADETDRAGAAFERTAGRAQVAADQTQRTADGASAVGAAVAEGAQAAESAQVRFGTAFAAIATDATSSGAEVKSAFAQALDTTRSEEDVKRLAASLRVAFEAGKISAEEFGEAQRQLKEKLVEFTGTAEAAARRAAEVYQELQAAIEAGASPEVIAKLRAEFEALNNRIAQAEAAARGFGSELQKAGEAALTVEQAMTNLGLKSQRDLLAARDAARLAFETIRQGAKDGEAATEDVRRAFVAYAQAALAAARDSSAAARAQVEAQLRGQAATVGATDALVALGIAGSDAGDKVAAGADQATRALQGTERAAQGAASAAQDMAASGSASAQSLVVISGAADQATASLNGVSEAFMRAALAQAGQRQAFGGTESTVFLELQKQSEELQRQIEAVREQNAQYDELEMRVRDLRGQFQYLSDDRLRQLAQEQLQLERNQQQREESLKRQREEAERQRAALDEINEAEGARPVRPTAGGTLERKVTVDVNVHNRQTGSNQFIEMIHLPEVQRALAEAVASEFSILSRLS